MTSSKAFLSYTRSDEVFVKDLYDRLTSDKVECFFDQESIGPGNHWVLALQSAFSDCNYLVLIMSPQYFQSGHATAEWTAIVADDPLNKMGRLVPLLLESCVLPMHLRTLNYIDVSTIEKFNANYPSIRDALAYIPPTDIKQRGDEITALMNRDDLSRAMKRLLDFAKDFADNHQQLNKAISLHAGFTHVSSNINAPLSDTVMVRMNLIVEALNLKDEIIQQISLQVVQ